MEPRCLSPPSSPRAHTLKHQKKVVIGQNPRLGVKAFFSFFDWSSGGGGIASNVLRLLWWAAAGSTGLPSASTKSKAWLDVTFCWDVTAWSFTPSDSGARAAKTSHAIEDGVPTKTAHTRRLGDGLTPISNRALSSMKSDRLTLLFVIVIVYYVDRQRGSNSFLVHNHKKKSRELSSRMGVCSRSFGDLYLGDRLCKPRVAGFHTINTIAFSQVYHKPQRTPCLSNLA